MLLLDASKMRVIWSWGADLWIVAVGAEEPLAEHMMVADFFREWTSGSLKGKTD